MAAGLGARRRRLNEADGLPLDAGQQSAITQFARASLVAADARVIVTSRSDCAIAGRVKGHSSNGISEISLGACGGRR